MARKRYSDEDVLKLLREIDVHLHDVLALVFIVLNYHRFMEFYYTPFKAVWLGVRDLVRRPRTERN